jgi:hypothetical protein
MAGEVRVDPLQSTAGPDPGRDHNDLLRAAVSAAWRHRDDGGAAAMMRPVSTLLREMMVETPSGGSMR